MGDVLVHHPRERKGMTQKMAWSLAACNRYVPAQIRKRSRNNAMVAAPMYAPSINACWPSP